MGLLSKITGGINKVMDSSLGWAVNWPTKLTSATTGLSATDQMQIGGALGALSGGLEGLSGLGSNLLGGLGSLFLDYFNLDRQWKYKKQAMELQDTFNKQAEQRQNQYNIQAENRAMQNNIQLWQMQNEYNAPAAQMQRLEDAGLNPNLAYGSVNTTAGAVSAPASHGVTTRANKALVKEALALNYQQLVSNQLSNQMMQEQIADKRANRMIALSEVGLDREYKKAQIDAMRNGISVRGDELGLKHVENAIRQQEIKEQNAWRRYQDDMKRWQHNIDQMPWGVGQMYEKTHRKPMYMDYL